MLIDYDTWAGASAWGSYSSPHALLYHFVSIFTVSYFFHSSLCFLLILTPTQFPSPLFNLIFRVSYPFPVSLLYLEGIRDFKTERERHVTHTSYAETTTYTYFASLSCLLWDRDDSVMKTDF